MPLGNYRPTVFTLDSLNSVSFCAMQTLSHTRDYWGCGGRRLDICCEVRFQWEDQKSAVKVSREGPEGIQPVSKTSVQVSKASPRSLPGTLAMEWSLWSEFRCSMERTVLIYPPPQQRRFIETSEQISNVLERGVWVNHRAAYTRDKLIWFDAGNVWKVAENIQSSIKQQLYNKFAINDTSENTNKANHCNGHSSSEPATVTCCERFHAQRRLII